MPDTPSDDRKLGKADRPVPPWEQPGFFRLDCEPHRGKLLGRLGLASGIVGGLSMIVPPLAVVGLLLSGITWHLARRDLALMQQGLMDPRGDVEVEWAGRNSRLGFILSCVFGLCWTAFLSVPFFLH